MLPYVVGFLSMTALVAAAQWNDFTNNFATDIAPIIALFGEQVTKQFLSESTSFLDNIIFGVAPLGIITAVVSVIRVYGGASLKSFIGRAQEPHGVAEAELCSSTSQDVCELWSNGGICRVFGRPTILEFLYTQRGDFYPKFVAQAGRNEASHLPSCGIDIPRIFLSTKTSPTDDDVARGGENLRHWEEVSPRGSQGSEGHPERGKDQERFAPYPNLSLNIGIRTAPTEVLWITAVFGVLLQLSFFVFATWATFYAPALYDNGGSPQPWSFCLAASGTALIVFGMTLCAMLIERKSCERMFVEETSGGPSPPTTAMFWLQPGGQRVGDQLFTAFAHSEKKREYVTSWKVDAEEPSGNDSDFIRYPLLILWLAILSTLLGFVCQFVGLRGLHGSITLFQLASTLCMAIIRAFLRSRRLGGEQNQLGHLHRAIEGHELDWQALNIESPHEDDSQFSTSYRSKCT
jgi:hypothetical protein